MAAYHDVTVLCADGPALDKNSYRDAVSRYFVQHGEIPGLRVVYVEQPPKTLRYASINRKLMVLTKGVWGQPLFFMGLDEWHRAALKSASDLGLQNFDIVHQLTPISFLRPGYLWTTDKPFFWGPICGMYKVPREFAAWSGPKSQLLEMLRSANIDREVSTRRFKSAVLNAKFIWTITQDELQRVSALAKEKATPMIETAPPGRIVGRIRKYDGTRQLRLCWSGNHLALKALPLLLHALARLSERQKIVLDVLGEGPEMFHWQGIAKTLSLSGITWLGRLPYDAALQIMNRADVLIHTSFREGTPHVVLEALGWGVPVICHDVCGMATAVNDTCGIKVPFVNPERSIQGFCEAIESLLKHPEQVAQLSEGALQRAAELSWDAKVKQMAEAYTEWL
jgi:glycosyltransferase involved in cell wall biosynthesis